MYIERKTLLAGVPKWIITEIPISSVRVLNVLCAVKKDQINGKSNKTLKSKHRTHSQEKKTTTTTTRTTMQITMTTMQTTSIRTITRTSKTTIKTTTRLTSMNTTAKTKILKQL